MRIRIDALDRRLPAALAAPPIRIADEEQLLVREVLQAGKILIPIPIRRIAGPDGGRRGRGRGRGALLPTLPRRKRRADAAGIRDVLAQRQPAVDMQGLAAGPGDGEGSILIDEALRAVLEGAHGARRPPVRVVAVRVVVAAGRVEGVAQLVARDGPEGAVGQVGGRGDVEDGGLHDARREDDLVARRVVVRVYRRHRHAPFVAVDGPPERGPLVGDGEAGHGEGVGEEGAVTDVDGLVVVFERGWVHDVGALGLLSDEYLVEGRVG